MSKDEYLPINIPNKELLCDTIESNLIDILINNKKEYNIFANLVICYIKKGKIDEEENETEEEEKKEMIEKRKKELEKLDKDKNISVTYKPNGKKVYYKLTEDLFFNSSISEKLISNQQIKEWAIIQLDNFLQHIETVFHS